MTDRGRWVGVLLCLPLAAFLVAVFLVPLGGLLPASLRVTPGVFTDVAATPSPSLANFSRALSPEGQFSIFRHSLVLSASVALASLVICLPAAWMLARHKFRAQGLLRMVLALPLTFSGVIVGFLAILVLGRLGVLPTLLRLLTGEPLLAGSAYTLAGLASAYIYFEVPRAVLTLEAAIRRLDHRLDQAAASLGAGFWKRWRTVHLPLLWPAMVSTLAITFAASMGSFGVALILARRLTIVPLEIYTQYTGFLDTGFASALCLLLAGTTLAANAVLRRVAQGGEWVYG